MNGRGGFAKVFSSLWDGTLADRWETWSVFVFMLAHSDAEGVVDMTPEAIARRSCIPADKVRAALEVLMAPDPNSRTPDHDGRRIVLIDEHRTWGWRVVNHGIYRTRGSHEVASLQTKGYVYAVGVPGESRVKIGFSKNPWARIADLRVVRPKLQLLGVTAGTLADEKDTHKRMERWRLEGEWFSADGDVLDWLAGLHSSACEGVDDATGSYAVATKKQKQKQTQKQEPTRSGVVADGVGDEVSEPLRGADRRPAVKRARMAQDGPEAVGACVDSSGTARGDSGATSGVHDLPVAGGGTWQPKVEQLEAWRAAFPALDLDRELAAARAWLLANPTRGKTRRGMAAFVQRWLARSGADAARPSARGSRTGADARYLAAQAGVPGVIEGRA